VPPDPQPDYTLEDFEDAHHAGELLRSPSLTDTEKEILMLRFAFYGGEQWTWTRISEDLEIEKKEVKRIAKGAVEKLLKESLSDSPPSPREPVKIPDNPSAPQVQGSNILDFSEGMRRRENGELPRKQRV
jgi:hypothetical protein